MTYVCMKMCSEPIVWLSAHLHAHVSHSGHCTFTWTLCVLVNVQWSDCLICSCNWAVVPMSDMCMKVCSERIFWLSAHLHEHVSHTAHCMFTCTWCVYVNVHWSDCPMCSCIWGVSRVTQMCMEMCSETSVWLTVHLHAHVRYSGHCTFTSTWRVHVNVQWYDRLMCSIIGQWEQWLMCAWKCAVSQLSYSLHIYIHTSDTPVTAHLHALDVCM